MSLRDADHLHVFLINLDRSTDRLAFMRSEADRIGLRFERVSAVNGTAVPDDLRRQFLNSDGSSIGAISAGEVGCYASHLTVYQRMLAARLPCALVLEDDVCLTPHLTETVQAAVAAAPQGWDYIHLSSVINRAVYAIAELPGGCHLIRHMRPPTSTGGYIISRSGAAKMLTPAPRTRTIDMDMKLAFERNLDVLGVYPSPVVWGDHLPSTIWSSPQPAPGAADQRRSAGHRKPRSSSHWATLRGHFHAAHKLGIAAYIRCRLASLQFALERRLVGRPRGAIPIVKPR